MNILVIGSGGREHAIIHKLNEEDNVKNIYCARGNAGISKIAELVDIDETDFDSLIKFAKEKEIDFTIVGPEVPLCEGIADRFEEEGLKVFGVNKKSAKLEGSKSFSKEFFEKYSIASAKYVECDDFVKAKNSLKDFSYPVVIKADGLCAGKGVLICESEEDAIRGLEDILVNRVFKEEGSKVVIEEFLEGIETSIIAFVDKSGIVPMVSAKDHKKIFNGEVGLNTGGMGTISPSTIYNDDLEKQIKEEVLYRAYNGFLAENLDFRGILFVGLMITKDGPKVLEFNTRFGDPETQVLLLRLKTPLSSIIENILEDNLVNTTIEYKKESAVCVILSSGGYPKSYETGKGIVGLDKIDDEIVVFHSGTKYTEDQRLVTNGGRVLGVCALGENILDASNKVYKNIQKISFEGMHYRTDIK